MKNAIVVAIFIGLIRIINNDIFGQSSTFIESCIVGGILWIIILMDEIKTLISKK